MATSGTVTITIRAHPSLKRRLIKAQGKDTLNAVAIEAIEQWLERQEKRKEQAS